MKQISTFLLISLIFSTKAIPSTLNLNPQQYGRVIGGQAAEHKQFPWQVLLVSCQADGKTCGSCGGSVIAPKFILTAAHCTDNKVFFDIGFGSTHYFKQAVRMKSDVKIQHAGYNRPTLENDVSLIKLPEAVQTSDLIQIISLAPADIGNLIDQPVLVSGFGKTNSTGFMSLTLNFVGLKVIANADCQTRLKWLVRKGQMCTLGQASTQAICQGDSGGPLVMKSGTSYIQVGVVSFSSQGCVPDKPSGYARVSDYIDWIKENMVE